MDLCGVDLSKLVGGESFTLPCTISKNGIGIKTRTLIDTGANGFIFIDTSLASLAARHLDVDFKELEKPYTVKGFDGKRAKIITHYLELNLHIDRTKQQKLPMLVVKLGGHDMILGRAWAEKYNTLVDCCNRQLIWPDEAIDTPSWNKVISTHKKNLFPKAKAGHQLDADRRDKLLAKDTWRPQILRRTHTKDQASQYQAMEQELQVPEPKTRLEGLMDRKTEKRTAVIDICGIGAAAFQTNLRKKENVLFCTSLHEIDQILQIRKEGLATDQQISSDRQENETELQWLKRLLPKQYQDYADVFSKEASDRLPPSRPYDHKIQLEKDGASELGYSPLYHQSTAELEEVKRYLVENLAKGFIETSQAPFASPILFVKKPTGGLRFCIDYRKLNRLTKKDRYPLPLIDETLARLAQAKIFTKLDIRQAFY
jgi:predicted aspartyl protease